MKTTVATAVAAGEAEAAAGLLARDLRAGLGGADPVLVMFFASTKQPLEVLAPRLTSEFRSAVVLGASTAGEFTERSVAKGTTTAVAVAGDFAVRGGMGVGLGSEPENAVHSALSSVPMSLAGHSHRTGLLLLDPLAGTGEEATLLTASHLGADIRLAGGAAGDDLQMKRTTVSIGDRVADDAIVIAVIFSQKPLGVGVCHGHTPISGTLSVTKASGAVVYEVDGRPAWDVWVDETRSAAAKIGIDPAALAPDEVGGFLLRYEAGLASGAEYKIRAPLSRNPDGSLGFACAVPEGAKIRITESGPQSQIASARTAAERAREQLGAKPAGAIVFDCICRNLILDAMFDRAVAEISDALGGVPLAGFETYGEIALDAGDLSGFHNTTTVVLAFPE